MSDLAQLKEALRVVELSPYGPDAPNANEAAAAFYTVVGVARRVSESVDDSLIGVLTTAGRREVEEYRRWLIEGNEE